ncbi:MAG TPA: hypothetical protein GXZ82_06940 [Firmicutes bacterium]|nr:hypothetical protein [Bacillota bacterium]
MSTDSQLKWWQRPVRMMRLDYGPELQRIKDADLAALARSKRHDWHINCEWVIGSPGVAPGTGQYATFATPHFEQYPQLGDWDLIRNYLPHARREGIRVLAYLNMHWFSNEFAAEHRDWEQLLANGTPYGTAHPLYGSGTTMCVNSGWRDWAFKMIGECAKTGIEGVFLDGPVIFPGCCYCAACRVQFKEQHGSEPPAAEDWSSPLWRAFIEFREDSMAAFLRDAGAALKAINPEGVIFLNAGSWHGGSWRVARNIEKVGEFQEFNGAEMFFHPGPAANSPIPWAITAKHLMAGGKPAVVFSHHTLGAWHYIPLPPLEAKMAAAETVACGANPWIAVFDFALDHSREETLAPIKELFSFLDEHEPYYTATESAAETAVLYSRQTFTYYVSHLDDLFEDRGTGREQHLVADLGTGKKIRDWGKRKQISDAISSNEFSGWCVALTRRHIPYDVILDAHVTLEQLRRYKVVVLPNAACLSDAQIAALKAYVAEGGSVAASFETGRYDENGQPREQGALDDLFGIAQAAGAFSPAPNEEYVQVTAPSTAAPFPEGRLLPRSTYAMRVKAADDTAVPVYFLKPTGKVYASLQEVSDLAAQICRQTGGRTAYFPHALGDAYTRYRILDHEQWLAAAADWAYDAKPSISVNALPTVQVEIRRQENRVLIHLVNHTGDTQRPYHFLTPAAGIEVVVRDGKPSKAFMLRSKQDCTAQAVADGAWSYTLPPVAEYDVLVLEK